MNLGRKKKIVLLGMMTKMPVAGVVWQNVHYLVGFQRLGYDVYYVEQHGRTPSMFMETEQCDGSGKAAAFIASVMDQFDLGDRWCFHALHDDGRHYGLSETQLRELFDSAELIINLHGGTEPRPEHVATGRLIYIETDPVELEIELHNNVQATIDFLAAHCAFFTFGENLGQPDCQLPVTPRFKFLPTRQPVVMDFWKSDGPPSLEPFTTIGNWHQHWRQVQYLGKKYSWSKDVEFLKFIDLPGRTAQSFELALASYTPEVKQKLESKGWRVRDAMELSANLDAYRAYIMGSRGEFTVAKEQNVQLRSGWFSDRGVTYLAAGRPVITQETGFSNLLPVGKGLFAFSSMDDILNAVETVNGDYEKHSRAAREIADEYFNYERVLGRLVGHLGIAATSRVETLKPLPTEKNSAAMRTGVNLCGYLRTESGVGAAARGYLGALRAVPLAVSLRDLSDLQTNRSEDRTILTEKTDEIFPINLVCADVELHYAILAYTGEAFFNERYNIAIWAWELLRFPERWHDRFAYYDEVWVATSFIANRLALVSPVPVIRLPPPLTVTGEYSRERGRDRLGFKPDEFLYLFIFDFNSHFARKNPLAVVDAFRRAFAHHEAARLVFKCVNAKSDATNFERLKRAADPSISIHEGYWSGTEMRDLVAACDAYVSLHRAEGTGLTITDAMALGKPVIATGWSGNMDFMNSFNSFPVDYSLVAIEENVGPYKAGETWAEPNVEHAASLMRQVFDHREEGLRRGAIARREIEEHYSTQAVAALIGERMRAIELRRRFADFRSDVAARYKQYKALPERIRETVRQHVSPKDIVLIVNKGDQALLRLPDCEAWHFPRGENGSYAGYYPADSAAAIAHLEELRRKGARYLLFPNTAFWWLDYYRDFKVHLDTNHRLLTLDNGACLIYALAPTG